MKVKWSVEGAGCQHARCGLKEFEIVIPDEEFEGMSLDDGQKLIDEYVQDEFGRQVYPHWEIVK